MNNKENNQRQHLGLRRGVISLGAVAALAFAAPVMAETINFESMPPAEYDNGVVLNAAGYNMTLTGSPPAEAFGFTGATALVINSNDPTSCFLIGCPSGATGNYLSVINDGGVMFGRDSLAKGFTVGGMDFAFLSPLPMGDGNYGQLQLSGVTWSGDVVTTALAFPGQDVNGAFRFGAAMFDAAFRANVYTSLSVNACVYDMDLNCVNSLDFSANNFAQFALDNVRLNAVPEPTSFLLFGLGLGALGLSRRRSARKAASSVTL